MTFDLEIQISFNMASKGSVGVYIPCYTFKGISTAGYGLCINLAIIMSNIMHPVALSAELSFELPE